MGRRELCRLEKGILGGGGLPMMLLAKEKGVWEETEDVRGKENIGPSREIRNIFPVLSSKSEYWLHHLCQYTGT